ncbi:cytochrome P450 [Mycena latifolia]|nr:cytochrome P450 [Mycena latifolia]
MSIELSGLVGLVALVLGALSYTSTPGPHDPPKVWSVLPWIGSSLQYILGPTEFMRTCRIKYGPIYKFVLGGHSVVILSTPETIASFYRQAGLGNELIIAQMYKAIAGLGNGPYFYELTFRKVFPIIGECFTPHRLDEFAATFTADLFSRLEDVPTGMLVKLSDFTGRHLYNSTISTLFGPHFPVGTYIDFYILDVETPTLKNNLFFTTARGLAARNRMLAAIRQFLDEGWTDEGDGELVGASPLVSRMIREFKDVRVSDADIAGLILSFMWGLQANTLRISFWLVAQLLARPDAMAEVCKEIRSASAGDFHGLSTFGAAEPKSLLGSQFPLLDSALKKTIRLNMLSTSMREAETDVEISGDGMTFAIKKGELVMGDVRAVHLDAAAFPDPDTFQYDRFVDGGGEKKPAVVGPSGPLLLARLITITQCKGRHFAVYAIKLFLIKTLELYDIRPLPGRASNLAAPKMNPRSIGVARTDEEIFVRLQRRCE